MVIACTLRCQFFAWLALQNRVWTSDRLARRDLPHQERCPFCDQDVEIINHLLIRCVFARETWDAFCQAIGTIGEAPTAADDLLAWTTRPALAGRHAKSLRALHLLIMWNCGNTGTLLCLRGRHRTCGHFCGKLPMSAWCGRRQGSFIATSSPGWLR